MMVNGAQVGVLEGLIRKLSEGRPPRGSNSGLRRHVNGFRQACEEGVSREYNMLLDIDDEKRIEGSPTKKLWNELYDPKGDLENRQVRREVEEARRTTRTGLFTSIRANRAERKVEEEARTKFAVRRRRKDRAEKLYQWAAGDDRRIRRRRETISDIFKYGLAAAGIVLLTSDTVRNVVYDSVAGIVNRLVGSDILDPYVSREDLRNQYKAEMGVLQERIDQYGEAEERRQFEAAVEQRATEMHGDDLQELERLRQEAEQGRVAEREVALYKRLRQEVEQEYQAVIQGLTGARNTALEQYELVKKDLQGLIRRTTPGFAGTGAVPILAY